MIQGSRSPHCNVAHLGLTMLLLILRQIAFLKWSEELNIFLNPAHGRLIESSAAYLPDWLAQYAGYVALGGRRSNV